jgi:hypothetical protein
MNNFPIGYQPYYPRQDFPKQNNPRIWVQGEAGAKSYLVAPNTSVDLWDSERQTIYVKSADASGMPTMRAIDYTVRENTPSEAQNYATRDELVELKNYIEGKLNALGGGENAE